MCVHTHVCLYTCACVCACIICMRVYDRERVRERGIENSYWKQSVLSSFLFLFNILQRPEDAFGKTAHCRIPN